MAKISKIAWEGLRKLVHISGLLTVIAYTLLFHYFSDRVAILGLTAFLLLVLEFEYLRIEHRPKIIAIFDSLFRKHEKNNLAGSVFYVISCIICFAAFDYWIAIVAMFMTAFGDVFAAIVGRAIGGEKIYKNKTWIGTLAGLASNILVGLLILPNLYYVVLPMAFLATFVEMITNKLDDNLTVPVFSGFLGQMIVYFFAIDLPPVAFSFLN